MMRFTNIVNKERSFKDSILKWTIYSNQSLYIVHLPHIHTETDSTFKCFHSQMPVLYQRGRERERTWKPQKWKFECNLPEAMPTSVYKWYDIHILDMSQVCSNKDSHHALNTKRNCVSDFNLSIYFVCQMSKKALSFHFLAPLHTHTDFIE